MRKCLQCSNCKQTFPREELINYKSKNYCYTCYREKVAREEFAIKVCNIFRILSPGPRIWTERKRIKEKFGYTDAVIIDTLDYLYNVKGISRLNESLYAITPSSINEAREYKLAENARAEELREALQRESTIHIISNDNKEDKIKDEIWDIENFL